MNIDDPYDKFPVVSMVEYMHLRAPLYIARIGDGTSMHDGIYTLIRKIIGSRLEEYRAKLLDTIDVYTKYDEKRVSIRDNGTAINLERLIEYIHYSNSKKPKRQISIEYDFWYVVVNGMSKYFEIHSYQDGIAKRVVSEYGKITCDNTFPTQEKNGTYVCFEPDETIFGDFKYDSNLIYDVLDSYSYLTPGLTFKSNDALIEAPNGLADLIRYTIYSSHALYPIIHFVGKNIEIAFTHVNDPLLVQESSTYLNRWKSVPNEHSNESRIFLSFVNGTITELGGTHQESLITGIVKTMRDYYGRNYSPNDILNGIVAAISIWVKEPIFADAGKYKLGGPNYSTDGKNIEQSIGDFIKHKLNDYLASHSEVSETIKQLIEKRDELTT